MARIEAVFVALAALDLDRLVAFYRGVFKEEPLVYQSDRYAEFALPGLHLALFKPQPTHRHEFTPPDDGRQRPQNATLSLCLVVDQLEPLLERLAMLGYPVQGAIATPSHGREVYAYDPEGNRLIVYEPTRGGGHEDGGRRTEGFD